MAESPPLGAAVVGLGVGEQHAQAYAGLPACRLRWVYDLDPARGAAVTARIGHGRVAPSLDAILGDPGVRIVSIASFDDAHAAQTVAALGASKHVFVEKPLCRDDEELARVRRAWRASGGHLRSNLVLRAAPLHVWLRAAVERGDFGDVYAFDGEYLYGRLPKLTDGWRKDVPRYSVMLGGGIHLADLMLGIARERPARVSAVGNRVCTAGTPFRGDDYVTATFEFPSGMVGRITANFGCVHPHHHVVRVFGTRASFVYDDAGPRWFRSRDPQLAAEPLPLEPLPPSKGVLIPDFVDAIVRGDAPAAGAAREFDLMNACIAADRALASGKTAEVDHDDA